mgnify:FL=1
MKLDDDSFLIPSRMAKWLNHFETSKSWPRNSVIGEYHSCYKTHSTLAQIPTINPDISGGWAIPKFNMIWNFRPIVQLVWPGMTSNY